MSVTSDLPYSESKLSLESLVESLLFVADQPVPVNRLAAVLNTGTRQVENAINSLQQSLQGRGLRLQRSKSHVQMTTAPEAAATMETFLGLETFQRLTAAALETLAIVAYQQPITRPDLDAIRGVNSDSVIKGLVSKGLLEEAGRSDGVGRPILYGTTPEFLQHFGLTSLQDLPSLSIESGTEFNESHPEILAENNSRSASVD